MANELEFETLTLTNSHHTRPINGRFTPDILVLIWARLPIKSLYQCRSVCKFWNSLITSDPLLSDLRHEFRHVPSLTPSPNLLLFLRHLSSEPVKVPDRPILLSIRPFEHLIKSDEDPIIRSIKNGFTPYNDYTLSIVPSNSNGPIICISADNYFYLCNPSTQEFFRLSPGKNGKLTTSNAAFGYLDDLNQYLLIGLQFGEKSEIFEFGPGEAGSNSWRQIKQQCPVKTRGFGLMVNRVFYWKVLDDPGFVVCLDIKEEKFKVIQPPIGNENEVILHDLLYLVEFKGSLCAVDNFSKPPRMQIWMLDENKEGEFNWVRKINIFISGMDRDIVYPFCDYEGENGGEIVLCNDTRSRLYCYNMKNRSIKQVFRPKQRTNDLLGLYSPGLFPLSIAG
ncbi:unnamed protein product [Amaranthus hypochondriacus]